MIGDFYGERVAQSIESWLGRNAVQPSQAMMENHIEFSEQSLEWSPINPRYKELQARLLIMQVADLSSNNEVLNYLDQILELHKQAAVERPQWPFSWANIAFLKSFMRQFDDEYEMAVQNAIAYGPYEVGALQRVVQSGTRSWNDIGTNSQDLIFQAVANSAEIDGRSAQNLKKNLVAYNLRDQVCENASFHSETSKKRICN